MTIGRGGRNAVRALAVALAVAGCGPDGPRPTVAQMAPGAVPLTPEHTLTAGDEFEIRFPFDPELNDRVTVGSDGTVSPKMLGSVIVGGLTVPEATARLKSLYARQIRRPDVSLTVRAYAPSVYYVEGEVGRPGLIRNELPLTVARAVAQAGGLKTGAKASEVLVIRRDAEGRVQAYKAGLRPPPGALEAVLKSFDVVYVPKSAIGSVNDFLASYVKNLPFSATLQLAPTPTTNLNLPVTTAR